MAAMKIKEDAKPESVFTDEGSPPKEEDLRHPHAECYLSSKCLSNACPRCFPVWRWNGVIRSKRVGIRSSCSEKAPFLFHPEV